MSGDFWYEAGLIAAGLILLTVMVLASLEGRSRGRHAAGPVCPCGCGRHPSEHVEVLLSHVPPQSRRSL